MHCGKCFCVAKKICSGPHVHNSRQIICTKCFFCSSIALHVVLWMIPSVSTNNPHKSCLTQRMALRHVNCQRMISLFFIDGGSVPRIVCCFWVRVNKSIFCWIAKQSQPSKVPMHPLKSPFSPLIGLNPTARLSNSC